MKAVARIEEVLRYLGYSGQDLDRDLLERIERLCLTTQESTRANFVWRPFALQDDGDAGRCAPAAALPLPGRDIGRYLADARAVVVLACTLGPSSEIMLRRHALRGTFEQLVVDAALSALVEDACDAAHREVQEWAAGLGLGISDRFSPGYGDFPLDVQQALLNSVDAGKLLGVTASAQGTLIPSKTVTAVIGVFENDPQPAPLGCAGCGNATFCTLRLRGITCYRSRAV